MANLTYFNSEVITLAQKIADMRGEDMSVTMLTALGQLELQPAPKLKPKRDMDKIWKLIHESSAYIRENNINMNIDELYDDKTGLPK